MGAPAVFRFDDRAHVVSGRDSFLAEDEVALHGVIYIDEAFAVGVGEAVARLAAGVYGTDEGRLAVSEV